MEINKNDIPYIEKLLEDINKTGVVCKQDVMSLESMIDFKLEDININGFTTTKSSTNVKYLRTSLENILTELNYVKEESKNITDIFKLLDSMYRPIDDYIKRLGNNIELNYDVIADITDNNLLTKIDGNSRTNLAMSDVSNIGESELNYILEILGTYLGNDQLKNTTDVVNEINAIYYQKPKELFSLLRTLNNKDLSFRTLDESTLSEVTIKDLINNFVVNDKLKSNLINLKDELNKLKVDLTFDKVYDMSANNEKTIFTYDFLYRKLENLNYLLKDTMSITIVILFKILLIKTN